MKKIKNEHVTNNFSRLVNVGWVIISLPIVFNLVSYILLSYLPIYSATPQQFMYNSKVVNYVYIGIGIVILAKWWGIIKEYFNETFIKLTHDKRLGFLLLPFLMISFFSAVALCPFILSKKFIGTKKQQKILKTQGAVSLLVCLTLCTIKISLLFSFSLPQLPNYVTECKKSFVQDGLEEQVSERICKHLRDCMLEDDTYGCCTSAMIQDGFDKDTSERICYYDD